jgi:transposase
MTTRDTRCLSPNAQEDLRFRVVQALRGGLRNSLAARTFGVSRTSIDRWLTIVELGNITSLKSKPRGRPKGTRLAPYEAATTVRLITDRCPDQLKLPFALWTREAVQQLLAERFGLDVSVWTVGRYLAKWGLTPQKPLRRAYERDPVAVQRWLDEEYPAIGQQAKAENAEIHWGDQMGLRSDHQTGTSYGRRGQTPVIPGTGQRFRCNVMSTITNRGALSFMVFKQNFNGAVFIRFVQRLLRLRRRKVLLIVDRHPVHLSAEVKRWLAGHTKRLQLFFLPGYSPDLNPDEFLNQDVKSNALGRQRPATRTEMITGVRSYLSSTQRQPEIVKNYFHAESVRYAAE